ncbi:MAG TPA: hypothetical protein VMR06_02825 [Dokdonella sp.]|uniref:hypothetical protein n=1 Tax=Dokdonella sp. TaxID=2291710 RepID=UPI002C345F59|nr:hypothetical protein [Dokdonella sp.]HUD40911.1 hypothetical protein [Dokdonella sp.]
MKISEASEVGLSSLAFGLAKFLAQESSDGREAHAPAEVIFSSFEDLTRDEIKGALYELKILHLVDIVELTGKKFPSIRVKERLFFFFDYLIYGNDPEEDAIALARLCLEKSGTVPVAALHKDIQWDLRRFNPALSALIARLPVKRVSREHSQDYSARYFLILDEDRAMLRRLVAVGGGS